MGNSAKALSEATGMAALKTLDSDMRHDHRVSAKGEISLLKRMELAGNESARQRAAIATVQVSYTVSIVLRRRSGKYAGIAGACSTACT